MDGVWLEADNSNANRRFLATEPLRDRRDHLYLGLGLLLGYRWVSTGGWFAEPALSNPRLFLVSAGTGSQECHFSTFPCHYGVMNPAQWLHSNAV